MGMCFMLWSATGVLCTGPAYLKMIEAAKAEQGQLILVVLGPLTNVALACKLDSQLPSRSKPHLQNWALWLHQSL